MARGGICDQLGGGFHRYSVDAQWRVPHFEKMLYDQAQMAIAYLEAYQITHDHFFAGIARATLEYVLRDLTGPHGAFCSAEDADSPILENPEEQGEGAFYVWTKKDIETLLGVEEGQVLGLHFGIEENGNALSDPLGEFAGKNILYIRETAQEIAQEIGKSVDEVNCLISETRETLFEARSSRPRPHLDDKVLTSWNGLMIGALALGARILDEQRYGEAAEHAARFVLSTLRDTTRQRLFRRYRDGSAGLDGHLEDYAFFVQGLLDLYESTFCSHWMENAIVLTKKMIELLWDSDGGGFFDTSGEDASILLRTKENFDGAVPSGNAVAALNLVRLAAMTDNEACYSKGVQTVATYADDLKQYPSAMPPLVVANECFIGESVHIIIAGRPESPDSEKMLQEAFLRFLPGKILILADGGANQKWLATHLPFVRDIIQIGGKTTAYVCENYVCRQPTTDVEVLAEQLDRLTIESRLNHGC